ncbi:MAG: amidohydrolase family protein [Archangium sp.]|nr:amidohydrolase family protein [Archangium sp.]
MLDLLIRGGTVVDGTGAPARTADVGVRDGRIVEVGSVSESAKETVDANGAWVTPGFVDIHTHYDGQASWDEQFSPSIFHGVTTLVMGNCGVGFAPMRPGHEGDLIKLMEGVEDIPGVTLAEGIRWGWKSFPEYMRFLEAMPHSLDFLTLVPHDPIRMQVMKERALAHEAATPDDIAAMRTLVREALEVGAAGFSTGRSDNHRTAEGKETPAAEASLAELTGIAQAFQGLKHGNVQLVSDFDLLRGPERFDVEFDIVEHLAKASGRPVSLSWLQRDPGGEQWKAIRARAEQASAKGFPVFLQAGARGIGVIIGLDASFHPFMGFPGIKEISNLPVAERAAAMRDPARRKRVLSEKSEPMAGDNTPIPPLVDILLSRIAMISGRMFPLGATLNYEPSVRESFAAQAQVKGVSPLEVLYDYLAEGDGTNLIYFPIFNYNEGNLDVVHQMLSHPQALFSLADAGAHVGTVCDASFTTFMLTHWVRDRPKDRLTLERAVEMMTSRNAKYLGLNDRGVVAVGKRADLNVIDGKALNMGIPRLMRDLPAGGKRFVQKAQGYVGTWVNGVAVQRSSVVTEARPGKLVRVGQGGSA